jgi:hypothetical protein
MNSNFDIVDLASEIAEIARTTTDPDTGHSLMRLVHRLLTEAGLDPESDLDGANAAQRGDRLLRVAGAD